MVGDSPRLWAQFRRLLLGTAVEVFRDGGIRVDPHALRLEFEPESLFHYPALHCQMRFIGSVHAQLLEPPTLESIGAVEQALLGVWPEIVDLVRLPMIGVMDVKTNDLVLVVDPPVLSVRFDLSAE